MFDHQTSKLLLGTNILESIHLLSPRLKFHLVNNLFRQIDSTSEHWQIAPLAGIQILTTVCKEDIGMALLGQMRFKIILTVLILGSKASN